MAVDQKAPPDSAMRRAAGRRAAGRGAAGRGAADIVLALLLMSIRHLPFVRTRVIPRVCSCV